jgi:hypothetical protein
MALKTSIHLTVVKTLDPKTAKELGINDFVIQATSYARVVKLTGDKSNIVFNVEFLTFENRNRIKNSEFAFIPNMNSENFIKQAYAHLKTLPEFANATDC